MVNAIRSRPLKFLKQGTGHQTVSALHLEGIYLFSFLLPTVKRQWEIREEFLALSFH
jgi:hypothetical protein